MTINVLPTAATPDDTSWAVFACDGNTTLLIGTSKHSHDCDSAAERLAAGELRLGEIFADPDSEEARTIMAEFVVMGGAPAERLAAGELRVVNHFPEDRQRIMQIFAEIKARKKKGK